MPSFTSNYISPGFYLQSQDVSNPNVTPGTRVVGIVGQGAKTLARTELLTKGAVNGRDANLSFDTVINLVSAIDENNVVYKVGTDFVLYRNGAHAQVDWSPVAAMTGSVDLTTIFSTPATLAALNAAMLRLSVNGGTSDPTLQYVNFLGSFTNGTTPAQFAAMINSYDASLVGVASVNAANQLVLSASSVEILEGTANGILGFTTGQAVAVKEPATGITYSVQYISDKIAGEYGLDIFAADINGIVAAYGEKRPKIEFDNGTASGSATSVLTDATKAWTTNEWVGFYVRIVSGTGTGQVRVVISNTTTALTLSQDWHALMAPDASSHYSITDVNDNTISKGAQISTDTGATVIITSQYADDIFNDINIKQAIVDLESDIAGVRAYTYVLMRGLGSTEVDPINFVKAQIHSESSMLKNRWCSAVFGLATGNETWGTFATLARGTAERRIDIVNLTSLQRDFGFGVENLDGSYLAAAHAGVICANELASVGMTRRSIGAAFSVALFADPFTPTEKNLMGAAGVTIYERQGTDLVLRDDLTTDQTTQLAKYRRNIRMGDYVFDTTKSGLETMTIGQTFLSNADGSTPLINRTKAACLFLWRNLQDQGVIMRTTAAGLPGIQNFTVTQNQTDPTQLDINAVLILVSECKYVFALIGLGV